MSATRVIRWAVAAAVFVVVAVAAFLPVMFALAPADGDDFPSAALLAAAGFLTAGGAALAAWEVDRLLRPWTEAAGADARGKD